MLKWLFISFGSVSVLSGILTFWLPLPIGIPLMLFGTALLARYSPLARRQISRAVQRYPHTLGFLRRLLTNEDKPE